MDVQSFGLRMKGSWPFTVGSVAGKPGLLSLRAKGLGDLAPGFVQGGVLTFCVQWIDGYRVSTTWESEEECGV